MIKSIEASNFMGFETLDLQDLHKYNKIEIIGDNGAGKSAILETLPFCLYGETRNSSAEDAIRLGSNLLEAKITMKGLPSKKDILSVTRNRKRGVASGVSVLEINDKVEARGAEIPVFIESLLGVDFDSFMLTSFFGMDTNDKLMQASNSNKLEALQAIANISCFKAYQKAVSKRRSEVVSSMTAARALASVEVEDYDADAVSNLHSQITCNENKLRQLQAKIESISSDVDKVQVFVQERTRYQTQKEEITKQITKLQNSVREDKESVSFSRARIKTLINKKEELQTKLASVPFAEIPINATEICLPRGSLPHLPKVCNCVSLTPVRPVSSASSLAAASSRSSSIFTKPPGNAH